MYKNRYCTFQCYYHSAKFYHSKKLMNKCRYGNRIFSADLYAVSSACWILNCGEDVFPIVTKQSKRHHKYVHNNNGKHLKMEQNQSINKMVCCSLSCFFTCNELINGLAMLMCYFVLAHTLLPFTTKGKM